MMNSEANKYRKKPVVIDAIQWTTANTNDVLRFCGGSAYLGDGVLFIETLEDGPQDQVRHCASPHDWIIKGVRGEFYPCKPEIFAATYDVVVEVAASQSATTVNGKSS